MKYLILLLLITGLSITACDKDSGGTTTTDGTELIQESFFNASSLQSFQSVSCTLEDGTSSTCFQLTFSSNPVEGGPYCPETINDVAGLGFYDGATNPGLRVWARELLEDIEADGYNMVNDDGTVNIDDFSSGNPDLSVSNCLAAAANDNLSIVFTIPATPKLANSNNVITTVELIGLSLDGVPVNGDPPSAISGLGGGGGTASEINFPSLDPCGGHHDPAGYYHWHFVPEVMNQVLTANGITQVSCSKIGQLSSGTKLFGFAKDGYPIYAYASEPTDLDDCGGRTAATDEFPDGVYHYVASTTVAANVPKCIKGVAASSPFRVQ